MSNSYYTYEVKTSRAEQEDVYSYFVEPPSFSRQVIQRSSSETREFKSQVLQELVFNLETLQLKRKKAFYKWLVMTKSKSSLRVLERVLTSSKPTVIKTLWMLRAEWMRRGSYIIQKATLKLQSVLDPLRQTRLRWGFHMIGVRVAMKKRIMLTLSQLLTASNVKFKFCLDKLVYYKRNWEAIQKMGLLSMMREKLRMRQKLAIKELFTQTRMFRPFSLILKLHELFTRKHFHSKSQIFRKFKRGRIRQVKFGSHLGHLSGHVLAKTTRAEFEDVDLKTFEFDSDVLAYASRFRTNRLSGRAWNDHETESYGFKFNEKKRGHGGRHRKELLRLVAKSLRDARDGHERLEQQLSFDKTWMVARCDLIYQKLRNVRQSGDLGELKKLLGDVKMTKAMQALFIRNGLKTLENVFQKRRKKLFREMCDFGKYKQELWARTKSGLGRLDVLFKNVAKREKIKTFYQLRTGAVVSSKLSFLKKNLMAALFTLFKKKKYQAMRQIELFGLNERNQNNQKRTDEMNQRMRNMEISVRMAKVLVDIFFRKRVTEGNNFMVRLKNSSFMMRRVYRDQKEDDHDEVVRNTIIVANLVKHFRNKRLAVMFRYFQMWMDQTWEFEGYSGEFDEHPINSPQNPLYSSMDISKSPFGQSHFRTPHFSGANQSFG